MCGEHVRGEMSGLEGFLSLNKSGEEGNNNNNIIIIIYLLSSHKALYSCK